MGRMRQLLGLEEARATVDPMVEVLQESLANLELALEDRGWQQMQQSGEQEMSTEGLKRAAVLSRTMNVANPLIKRGLNVRKGYIWGGGVEISARDEDVNAVVQRFLDDPSNRGTFTGDQAQEELETCLGTDGNVFLACFTNPRSGRVQIRQLPFDQVSDVFTNPDDADEAWFYKRTWTQSSLDGQGRVVTQEKQAYYPALNFRPKTRARTFQGVEVLWDAPVYHIRVNRQRGWKFGIGDAYAALPWARSYRDFLADWATLVKALSQFAWKLSAGNSSKADKARQAVQRAGAPQPGNLGAAGGTAVMSSDMNLEAVPKTGATIDSESGKPLASMVAAALGIPVTMLLGDPGQTGARAVAETLDKPTTNEMNQRRSLWSEAYRAILSYAILQSVKAPAGELSGTVGRDPFTGLELVVLGGDEDASTIDVVWPSLEDEDAAERIKAIVEADGTEKLPPLTVVRLLLSALGVENIDELVTDMTDGKGNFIPPYETVGTAVGNAATAAFRRGQDPASSLGDEEDEE